MSRDDPIEVMRRFADDSTRAIRGEPVDPFGMCHPELTWTMTGGTPVAGTYKGLSDFRAHIGKALATRFRGGPGFGLYLVDGVAEGNRAAVILMGRGEGAQGATYNNIYFFFVEVRDGKLFRVTESYDGSLVWRAAFDRHLEDGPPD